MNTASLEISSIVDLAGSGLKKFRPGFCRLAPRAAWQPQEFQQVAFVAAANAIRDYDESKGTLLARFWFFVQQEARTAGFLPSGEDADLALAGVGGGGDPADVLDARRLAARLESVGFGLAPEHGADRSKRRHVVELRGAAERFAHPGVQAELF
jgi:hypothetical protein